MPNSKWQNKPFYPLSNRLVWTEKRTTEEKYFARAFRGPLLLKTEKSIPDSPCNLSPAIKFGQDQLFSKWTDNKTSIYRIQSIPRTEYPRSLLSPSSPA